MCINRTKMTRRTPNRHWNDSSAAINSNNKQMKLLEKIYNGEQMSEGSANHTWTDQHRRWRRPGGNEANTVSETEHFKIDYINKQGLDVQISGNNENSSILWIQLESANRMCVATRGENYSLLERKKCINGIFIWQLSHKLSHPYISLSRKMMIWLSQKMTKESTKRKETLKVISRDMPGIKMAFWKHWYYIICLYFGDEKF